MLLPISSYSAEPSKRLLLGKFKLAEKGVVEMTVDTDPFPAVGVNMVSFTGANKKKGQEEVHMGAYTRKTSSEDAINHKPVGNSGWGVYHGGAHGLLAPSVGRRRVERA